MPHAIKTIAFALGIAVAAPALIHAATLCGVVRDSGTHGPVAGANIEVWNPDDSPTAFQATTDLSGHFCIDAIPAGVYTLAVWSDGYEIAYRQNVAVGGVLEVDVPVQVARPRLEAPWPNPARDRVRFDFSLPASSAARLEVFDAAGRRVAGWSGASISSGVHTLS